LVSIFPCFAGGTQLGLYCSLFRRRNTLVAGEGKASTAVSINEYKYTVNIGDQHIRITGMRINIINKC
jgi:hypothetical protein